MPLPTHINAQKRSTFSQMFSDIKITMYNPFAKKKERREQHIRNLEYIEREKIDHFLIISGQNCAFLTLEIVDNTVNGVTSPVTVTFFAAKSILNDVTPTNNDQNLPKN